MGPPTHLQFSSLNRQSLAIIVFGTALAWLTLGGILWLQIREEFLVAAAVLVLVAYAAIMFGAHSPRDRARDTRQGVSSLSRAAKASIVSIAYLGVVPGAQVIMSSYGLGVGWLAILAFIAGVCTASFFLYESASVEAVNSESLSPLLPVSIITTYLLVGSTQGYGFLLALPQVIGNWNFLLKTIPALALLLWVIFDAVRYVSDRYDELHLELRIRGLMEIYLLPVYAFIFGFRLAEKFWTGMLSALRRIITLESIFASATLSVVIVLSAYLGAELIDLIGISATSIKIGEPSFPLLQFWIALALMINICSVSFEFVLSWGDDVVSVLARATQVSMNLITSFLFSFLGAVILAVIALIFGMSWLKYSLWSVSFINAGVLMLIIALGLYFWRERTDSPIGR